MKKYGIIILALMMAFAPIAGATYLPDNYTIADLEADISGTPNLVVDSEINTEAKVVAIVSDLDDIMQSSDINTEAKVVAIVSDLDDIMQTSDINTEAKMVAIVSDLDDIMQVSDVPTVVGTWVVAAGANTACDTTCGIATAVVALDLETPAVVATDAATADSCVCSGATS